MREIKLYVPTHDNDGKHRPQVLESVVAHFTSLAGGCSTVLGDGSFNGVAGYCFEPVAIVSVLVDDNATEETIEAYRAMARFVKDELAQEAVLFSVTDYVHAEFI